MTSFNLKVRDFYNTPHIALSEERKDVPLQVGHQDEESYGIPDLWFRPEKFRYAGTTEKHSLDTLA